MNGGSHSETSGTRHLLVGGRCLQGERVRLLLAMGHLTPQLQIMAEVAIDASLGTHGSEQLTVLRTLPPGFRPGDESVDPLLHIVNRHARELIKRGASLSAAREKWGSYVLPNLTPLREDVQLWASGSTRSLPAGIFEKIPPLPAWTRIDKYGQVMLQSNSPNIEVTANWSAAYGSPARPVVPRQYVGQPQLTVVNQPDRTMAEKWVAVYESTVESAASPATTDRPSLIPVK